MVVNKYSGRNVIFDYSSIRFLFSERLIYREVLF